VVVGHDAGPVATVVGRLGRDQVKVVYADRWADGNGASLAAVQGEVHGQALFVLATADHVFGEGGLERLLAAGEPAVLVDLAPDRAAWAEGTRVRVVEGAVVAFGKHLEEPAIDCGAFLLPPEVFGCQRQAAAEGDHTLAGAVTRLAQTRPLRAVELPAGCWWQDVATIWITTTDHIVQGTVKVNDTYLDPSSTYTYNTPEERLHVICQEVGHTFGLDHQSTSGATLGTCVDYYHNVAGDSASTLPDQGDYDQLACIYNKAYNGSTLTFAGQTSPYEAPHSCKGTGHDDGFTTVGAAGFSPAQVGLPAWANPSQDVYVSHLPNGLTQVSFVRWAKRP
jgi:choline kinase